MSTYRLNLSIDKDFANILKFFKANSPLLSDVEIIRMIVGEKYVEKKAKQNQAFKEWSDSLPVLELTDDEEKSLEQSVNSGSAGVWDTQEFIREMTN